jgi:catechol 2,3-dioxygenase-like lactoylglutathione lyase family enzyme
MSGGKADLWVVRCRTGNVHASGLLVPSTPRVHIEEVVMKFHKGRLIDHLHLRVKDLERSKQFYRACAEALDLKITQETPDFFIIDELFVSSADGAPSRVHFAFQAASTDEVRAFHAAATGNGGRDNGRPGSRDYHEGYYAAYVLDPDGNNVEAVCHRPE